MSTRTEHGYMVLADISGYTSFLAQAELEHAHEILTDLLTVIVEQFKQVLTISKLEGDAVFANVNETDLPDGELILDLIERTYFEFRQHREMCVRQSTCNCRACANIPLLELKFFVHHGDYIVQNIAGIRELVGSDINLIHRLTKNHISENTGWHAYTLFTRTALEHIRLPGGDFHSQTETYEHLGEVQTLSISNLPRYEEMAATNRVVIPAEQADYHLEFNFNSPPHLVWEWIMDVDRRSQAMGSKGHWSAVYRPNGHTGVGARNHCAHGKGVTEELIQDWRPFEYCTSMNVDGKAKYQSMYLLAPFDDGHCTHLEIRMKIIEPTPLWLSRLMVKTQFAWQQPYLHWLENVRVLMENNPHPGTRN